MTKTYRGESFAPIFYKAMHTWYEGGCNGPNPKTLVECCQGGDTWFPAANLTLSNPYMYRFKPKTKRTVTIGYLPDGNFGMAVKKTLIAPENIAPADGTYYYLYHENLLTGIWRGTGQDIDRLASGEVFLDQPSAQAMADWLAVCRTGGAT